MPPRAHPLDVLAVLLISAVLGWGSIFALIHLVRTP